MDESLVYTTKDASKKGLKGDAALRRQVEAPREELEYCSPLAIQTNGLSFQLTY